ncbi:type III-A CRISPR-associated protein Csm2 [Methylothermus subterraneus]
MTDHRSQRRPQEREDRSLGFTIQFRTADGKIYPELFDQTAERAAKSVADCRKEVNKPTQLRRFYDELVMWEEKVARGPDRFEEFLPFIRMLKAKVAYAKGRKLVDGAFVDLLDQTIDSVRDADDLKVAKLFLEAFMGFYKLERPKD